MTLDTPRHDKFKTEEKSLISFLNYKTTPSMNSYKSRMLDTAIGIAIGSVLSFVAISLQKSTKKNDEGTQKSSNIKLTPEMREEQLSRNHLFFGKGMSAIQNSKICVVGLGGVGSHAAHMLARAGVGMLRMIDFDQVTLSSLNRHAVATLNDVGIPKVEAMRRFFDRVCPDNCCDVQCRTAMYTQENEEDLLGDVSFDYVVDAIDDIPTKAALLSYCVRTNTRVISCMGAGGKSDPTRIHIGDLRSASRDPLAAKLKWCLRKMNVNIDSELISIIYSSETTVVPLADLTEEQKASGLAPADEYGAVDNMRVRVLPVLGTMPALMGQAQAAHVLCKVGQKPFSPIAGERIGKNVRHKRLQHFKNRENEMRIIAENKLSPEELKQVKESEKEIEGDFKGRLIGDIWVGPVQIDSDDVEYLLGEVWRNRCAVTGDRLGTVMELVRWDISKPSTCQNIVLLSMKAINMFDKGGKGAFSEDIVRKIETRLASCKIDALA